MTNSLAKKYEGIGKRLHLAYASAECKTFLNKVGELVEINVSEDPQYQIAIDRLIWRASAGVRE